MNEITREKAEALLAEAGFTYTGAPRHEWVRGEERGRLSWYPERGFDVVGKTAGEVPARCYFLTHPVINGKRLPDLPILGGVPTGKPGEPATATQNGIAQDGTVIIEVRCDECGDIVTVTGVTTKVVPDVTRHYAHFHGEEL
jgi:hypothetical protein